MVKYKEMLFKDFLIVGEITDLVKKNSRRVFTGGVRINNGMYRTTSEEMTRREKELKRKLP